MDLRVCNAIRRRNLMMFGYRGTVRVVEPHLYGRTTAGNEALSAWMRPGWSRTDPEGGWRMFLLDELTDVAVLPELFPAARPDFNPDDRHFTEVFCRVKAESEESAATSHAAT
jgi:hypothetical protein